MKNDFSAQKILMLLSTWKTETENLTDTGQAMQHIKQSVTHVTDRIKEVTDRLKQLTNQSIENIASVSEESASGIE
ncbi:putative methyl-accepting transducer [Bacillus tequilensis]|nr:putative methyl-accepting transducer [Bacillus tequilensis]